MNRVYLIRSASFFPVASNSTPTTVTNSAALAASGVATIPDLGRMVPIQITLPPQPGSAETQPRVLNIQVPAAALQGKFLNALEYKYLH